MERWRDYQRLDDLTADEKTARRREQNRRAAQRYRAEHRDAINKRRRERYASKKNNH